MRYAQIMEGLSIGKTRSSKPAVLVRKLQVKRKAKVRKIAALDVFVRQHIHEVEGLQPLHVKRCSLVRQWEVASLEEKSLYQGLAREANESRAELQGKGFAHTASESQACLRLCDRHERSSIELLWSRVKQCTSTSFGTAGLVCNASSLACA